MDGRAIGRAPHNASSSFPVAATEKPSTTSARNAGKRNGSGGYKIAHCHLGIPTVVRHGSTGVQENTIARHCQDGHKRMFSILAHVIATRFPGGPPSDRCTERSAAGWLIRKISFPRNAENRVR